jgi:hypothetical protein
MVMKVVDMLEDKVSRRGLIKGAAGVADLTMGGFGFLSKSDAAKKSAATLPWPYKKFTAAGIKEAGNIGAK